MGTQISVELTGATGRQTVIDIPRWDFHWQGTYELVQPIRVAPVDGLTLRCTYDNTQEHRAAKGFPPEPTEVRWGEGTFDEMCPPQR